MNQATCFRCGADTGEDLADVGKYVTYCQPCRAVMVLPCDCGGSFDRSSSRLPTCSDCGARCGYWDDSDLVDLEGMG